MKQSYDCSPFRAVTTENESWILWEKRNHLLQLNDRAQLDQAENTISSSKEDATASTQIANVQPMIHRAQYHAVLNRMNRAMRNSAAYSAWQT